MIFESHAHFDDDAFNEDRDKLLKEVHQDGIKYIINVAASLKSCETTIKLIKEYPFLYGAIGVHPSETGELTEKNFVWMKDLFSLEKVVAVGEIGLDYYWNEPEIEIQKNWFIKQLKLAEELEKPVIIHSRDAAKDTLTIMKEYAKNLKGVIHCYSYSKEVAKEYLDMDYYFGIGGVVTFQNAKKLKEVVEYLPIEKILLETDSPYLSPVPYRGKRNSSLNLPIIAEEIAKIKGISYDSVIEITGKNAMSLFQIEKIGD